MTTTLKTLFFCIGALLLTGCYTSFKVTTQNYKYDNDINFTIDKIDEGQSIATGSGHYYAQDGFKFVFLHVSLKNNSNEDRDLDFANFYLLDPNSHTRYKVEFAMLESGVNIFGRVNSEIQKNDTKKRKLVFSFPKYDRAESFSVNNDIYQIKYLVPSGN